MQRPFMRVIKFGRWCGFCVWHRAGVWGILVEVDHTGYSTFAPLAKGAFIKRCGCSLRSPTYQPASGVAAPQIRKVGDKHLVAQVTARNPKHQPSSKIFVAAPAAILVAMRYGLFGCDGEGGAAT